MSIRFTPFLLVFLTSSLSAQEKWTPRRMMDVVTLPSMHLASDGSRAVCVYRKANIDKGESEFEGRLMLVGVNDATMTSILEDHKQASQPQWSGKRLAFLSKRDGKNELWLHDFQNPPRRVSPSELNITTFKWAPDGSRIAFTALDPTSPEQRKHRKEKNDAYVVDTDVALVRLYVVAVDGPDKTKARVYKTPGSVRSDSRGGFDWSPDSTRIVFAHVRTPGADDWGTADLSILELESTRVTSLVATRAAELSPIYSPDGKSIAYLASDDPPTWPGSGRIHVIPANGGTPKPLAVTPDGWGRYSELLGWAKDGSRLYFQEIHGTTIRIGTLSLDAKTPITFVSHDESMILGGFHYHADTGSFLYGFETMSQPPELRLLSIDSDKPRQVLAQPNKDLTTIPLGNTVKQVWQNPNDKQQIEGLVTYPVGYVKGQKYPLLVVVHGGPMGVFMQNYLASPGSYPLAAFASQGYAILRCNIRGSSGYGEKFRYANRGDWGGMDYFDMMAGVDHLIAQGLADPQRMGIMGWSYGGFMSAWTITQTDRFKAASIGAPVTNLVSFTGTADIPSFLPDYFGGEFWNGAEAGYRKHSPLTHVKNVRTPAMIQHGERDERVPISQGYEFYNALKRQGCVATMVVYPRTPHGIEEPRLLLDCMERNVEWFGRYLAK